MLRWVYVVDWHPGTSKISDLWRDCHLPYRAAAVSSWHRSPFRGAERRQRRALRPCWISRRLPPLLPGTPHFSPAEPPPLAIGNMLPPGTLALKCSAAAGLRSWWPSCSGQTSPGGLAAGLVSLSTECVSCHCFQFLKFYF